MKYTPVRDFSKMPASVLIGYRLAMGTNRFREICQGDDSLQLILSSKDVIEIWSAMTGTICVQIGALRASSPPIKLIL
jgi:hypothetical protein